MLKSSIDRKGAHSWIGMAVLAVLCGLMFTP